MPAIDDDRTIPGDVVPPSIEGRGIAPHGADDQPVVAVERGGKTRVDDQRRRRGAERAMKGNGRNRDRLPVVHVLTPALARIEQSLDDAPSWISREPAYPDKGFIGRLRWNRKLHPRRSRVPPRAPQRLQEFENHQYEDAGAERQREVVRVQGSEAEETAGERPEKRQAQGHGDGQENPCE